MNTDSVRLQMLLERLGELERRLPLPYERPILDVARAALREEISSLSHRLFDLRYTAPLVRATG